jgi:hypothetical protein
VIWISYEFKIKGVNEGFKGNIKSESKRVKWLTPVFIKGSTVRVKRGQKWSKRVNSVNQKEPIVNPGVKIFYSS